MSTTSIILVSSDDIDILKMILSKSNIIETPFKQTIRKLLDTAVASL